MRLTFSTDKDTLDVIKHLQEFCGEESRAVVVKDSIHFLYQIEVLLESGFKFAIIDEDNNHHYITKKRLGEKDEPESDEGEA